ncbi:MAG: hypothetical protein K2M27_08405 [Muribaculaceae bacterium]|nr:hypothetical protein [Muribaculaceae bacterium]
MSHYNKNNPISKTTRHEKLADGTEFIGVGIQPDVVVEETESIIFGKDNVIEEALKLLK